VPGADHEILLELFRSRPELLVALLRDGLGFKVPDAAEVRLEDASFTDLQPAEYRADLAFTLRDAAGRPLMAAVCEVQRAVDERKRFTWPLYLASLHARVECPTCLVVVALDPAVARWAAQPIRTMPPGELVPLVVGREGVPVVRTAEQARRLPELAVLSARAHGSEPDGLEVARAALAALGAVSADRVTLYGDWILSGLNEAARRALEAEMQTGNYEYQSEFVKRNLAQGRAEALANAVLTVLAARGIAFSDEVRARVLACTDLATLDRWLARAATAAEAAAVFAES
jgi:hypothetical protein